MKNCIAHWEEFAQFLQNSRLALFTAQWDLGTQQDHFGQIELFEEMEQLCEVLQGQSVSVEKKKQKTILENLKNLNEDIAGQLFGET